MNPTALGSYARLPVGKGRRVTTPDSLDISVREWGVPEGPEILFIHGIAQAHLCFVRQFASELAETFRLVAFDLRGHGESDKPSDPVFYREHRRWADEVATVIEAAGLRRPVVVGWSHGGRVLRQYLAEYGHAGLSGVVFISSRAIEEPATIGPGSRAILDARPADLARRIEADTAFLRNCFVRMPKRADFEVALAYNMMMPAYVRAAIAGWSADPARSRAVLAAVTVPVMIVHGLADDLVPPIASELIAEAIGHAQVHWYPGCGHSPFYENAERFNLDLAQFAQAAWDARCGGN